MQARREELAEMKAERAAHEAALLEAQRAKAQQRIDDFTRNRAAKLLQTQWRTCIAAKKKAAKATGGKGKGKGKK